MHFTVLKQEVFIMITLEHFDEVDMRVGTITAVSLNKRARKPAYKNAWNCCSGMREKFPLTAPGSRMR